MIDDTLPAERVTAHFDHRKNITVGRGRVIWAESFGRQVAGWALPGGERTQDEARATEAAITMHRLTEAASNPPALGKTRGLAASTLKDST